MQVIRVRSWFRLAAYSYNSDGTVKQENLNNSSSATSYSYNDRGFITSISNPAFGESIAYTGGYNGDSYYNGSIASDSYSYPGAPSSFYGYTYSYSYDQNNRMTNAGNSQNSGYSYTSIVYDANGNATDRWQGSTEYGFTYSGSNRPTAFVMNPHSQNPIIYPLQYDNDGNMTYNQYENRDLDVTYDPFTLMTQTMTEGSTQLDFEYDGRKERLLKTANGTMTLYLHGTNDYPLEQETGSATRFYVYGPTGLIAEVDGGVAYFVLKDHLGSTEVLLNSNDTPVSWYSYTPYGGLWQSATSEDVDYKFTGQEYDPETYLYNFRARIYDDALGIFYASDPADQTFSSYGYVDGNPVVYTDPTGQFFPLLGFFIASAIWGGAFDAARHNGGNPANWQFKYFAGGAASSVAGAGVGELLGPASSLLGIIGEGAATGAVSSGVEAAIEGGNVGTSAFYGGLEGAGFSGLMYAMTPAIPQSYLGTAPTNNLPQYASVGGGEPVGYYTLPGQTIYSTLPVDPRLANLSGFLIKQGLNPGAILGELSAAFNTAEGIGAFSDAVEAEFSNPIIRDVAQVGSDFEFAGRAAPYVDLLYEGYQYYTGEMSGLEFYYHLGVTAGAGLAEPVLTPVGSFAASTVLNEVPAGIRSVWQLSGDVVRFNSGFENNLISSYGR